MRMFERETKKIKNNKFDSVNFILGLLATQTHNFSQAHGNIFFFVAFAPREKQKFLGCY